MSEETTRFVWAVPSRSLPWQKFAHTLSRLSARSLYQVYLPERPEMDASEFLPLQELRTTGRAELRALLRALHEVTMLKHAAVLCDSEYIVDGFS